MSTSPISIGGAAFATSHHGSIDAASIRELSSKSKPATKDVKSEPTTPQAKTKSDGPGIGWWFMTAPALLTAGYGIFFIFGSPGAPPIVKERLLASWLGISHLLGGIVAVGLGPFQFLDGFRRRNLAVHRWVGRTYTVAIVAGSIGGVWSSMHALCYEVGQWGFFVLGYPLGFTVSMGIKNIWKGDVAKHKAWMMRSWALTYAAPMLRWQFPVFLKLGVDVMVAATVVAFTSWVPSLVFVEWWLRRSSTAAKSA